MARSYFLPVIALVLVGAAPVACATAGRSGFDTADAGSSSSGGIVPAEAGANQDGCSDQAKLVYVMTLEGDLYSFAPSDKKFTKVGPLQCGSGETKLVPISMAVDREATAWVNMRDQYGLSPDKLFKVDTKTTDCKASNIEGQMGGMGFSMNAGSTDQETLFVTGRGSSPNKPNLNRVDFAQEKLVPIGDFTEVIDLELTGTGDGKLFGFLVDTPLAIVQIDKPTLAYSDRVPLPTVERPRTPMFAFSFWGGDFYIYTATSVSKSQTSNVSRYRPSDGSVDTAYMTNIGFHIVGAGVSTCAPTSLPK